MEQWVGFSSYDGSGTPGAVGNTNDVDVQ